MPLRLGQDKGYQMHVKNLLSKRYLLCCICYDRLEQVLSDKKSRLKNLYYINNIFYATYATIGWNKGYQIKRAS